ncbi:MAG: type 1 glutamine amidotransferase [Coriobacteriia bacterium]|nr:type 1 glutamine amidotransferase [Coriobacteriia bacterium]
MHIEVIQHVPFEGPALIGEWAAECGHSISISQSITEEYPPLSEVDLLVVMGGPMDADDDDASPWLVAEKRYIADAIAAGKAVLGICLGAQIIAEVLGGRVVRGEAREIGWFSVMPTAASLGETLFSRWPDEVVVGHWHGDTFELPLGMEPVLSSEFTRNQAFVYDGRVVGLQFHIEWDEATVDGLLDACITDFSDGGEWVADSGEFLEAAPAHIAECRELLFEFLDGLEGAVERGEGGVR